MWKNQKSCKTLLLSLDLFHPGGNIKQRENKLTTTETILGTETHILTGMDSKSLETAEPGP